MYKSLYHGRQNLKSLVFLHSVRLQKSLYSAEDAQNTGSSNFYTSVGIRADSRSASWRCPFRVRCIKSTVLNSHPAASRK